ncbi:MAG: rhodanese-like domain-containing protein [Verrucomicrobiales bacterium]
MKNWIFVCVLALGLVGCREKTDSETSPEDAKSEATAGSESTEIKADELAEMLQARPGLVVIDIRTPAEFAEGHIEGAINIDFLDAGFAEAIARIDTSAPTAFHCRSGGRSGQAKPVFEALPFAELYHFSGGSIAWSDAGKPMVK